MGRDGVWCFDELGVFVKYGHRSRVHLDEALALRFINKTFQANQVPAPEVFGWKTAGDKGHETNFIYLSLLPGQMLRDAWRILSHDDKSSISHQLADIVDRLRNLQRDPTDQFIGSLNRGPVQDLYFSPDQHRGPFATAREFHDFVQFVSAARVPLERRLPEQFRVMLPDTARVCLTHGDLHLGNILVARSPDGGLFTVSGIVDWEQAGWYPEYWEYCKAMIVGPYGDEWREEGWVNIVLQPFEDEFEAFEFYWHSRSP